jgi:hypothetical protein
LRGGSTQTSSQGGAWRIDGNYYRTCTSGNRTKILVATPQQWASSNGNFVLNGSGMTATCVLNCGAGGYAGLVDLEGGAYVTIGGNSASQRLEVLNSGGAGADPSGIHISNTTSGMRVQWASLHNNTFGGISVGWASNWLVTDVTSTANGGPGFSTGMWVDAKTTAGGFVNCTSNGDGQASQGGRADAFLFEGGASLWCVNCTAYNAMQRGFNTGETGGGYNMYYRFRNLIAHDNGTTTDPNIARAGFGFSGDDGLDGVTQNNYIVGMILYRNTQRGGWFGYGNGRAEVWHGVFWGNGWRSDNPVGDIMYDQSSDHMAIYNSIDQKRSYNSVWGYTNANVAANRVPATDYNLWIPASGNTEGLSNFDFANAANSTCDGTFRGASRTFANKPCFIGSHSKVGSAFTAGFVATSDTSYASADFHLTAGSSAIDGGTFLMRANGAGTNATTISVLGNGDTNDPRNYFIEPASYLDAVPDTIQIQGCGTVTITSMTASSISFTPACSWANGAGIHLLWAGAAPDMGVFEFGLGVTAPTLLSVEAVP